MTSEIITWNWRPHSRTSKALLNAGYSQEQLNRIGKLFIERYLGITVDDASTKFNNMLRSSESGHNIKAPPVENIAEKHDELMSNKSDNGEEKAQEVKQSCVDAQMKREMAQMVIDRFGTDRDEANKIFNCVT